MCLILDENKTHVLDLISNDVLPILLVMLLVLVPDMLAIDMFLLFLFAVDLGLVDDVDVDYKCICNISFV